MNQPAAVFSMTRVRLDVTGPLPASNVTMAVAPNDWICTSFRDEVHVLGTGALLTHVPEQRKQRGTDGLPAYEIHRR